MTDDISKLKQKMLKEHNKEHNKVLKENKEIIKKQKATFKVLKWGWRAIIDEALTLEKKTTKNYLNCFVDLEKNISKIACGNAFNSYMKTNIYNYNEVEKIPEQGIGFIYSKRVAYKFLNNYRRKRKPFIYMDNSYFSRFYDEKVARFRMIVNGIHPLKSVKKDYEPNMELLPWRKRNNPNLHILICPPSNNPNNTILKSFGVKNSWLYDTIKIIRNETNRNILIRFKNFEEDFQRYQESNFFRKLKQFKNISYDEVHSQTDLLTMLDNAYALVAPASGASVIAAAQGIPVFSEDFGPVASISTHNYSQIDYPIYPSRIAWLNGLMAHEFTLEDIFTGKWLIQLKELYPKELSNLLDENIKVIQIDDDDELNEI